MGQNEVILKKIRRKRGDYWTFYLLILPILLCFIDIWSKPLNILVLKSKGRPVFKIWYTIWTFFINAFNIFKAKHDVSYDMIMYYCSFRAVAAHQQEVISTCFYRNIKYIDNIMITYEIIKISTSGILDEQSSSKMDWNTYWKLVNSVKLITILLLIFEFITKNCDIM